MSRLEDLHFVLSVKTLPQYKTLRSIEDTKAPKESFGALVSIGSREASTLAF